MTVARSNMRLALGAIGFALLLLASPQLARAGCGCTKPPPAPSPVRPAAAWSGSEVTLFGDALVAGASYRVRFRSGTASVTRFVDGVAILRRDLADAVEKPQIVVNAPPLPLGPTAIQVTDADGAVVIEMTDDLFTVAPQPIGIPTGVGVYHFDGYRAAVSRDGLVYLSLDFGDVQHARVFDAQAVGLPLRFAAEDVAFWNIQGFLMQLLGEKMPGLFAIHTANEADSDVFHYSRHEFNTWFLQHGERANHALDPNDPNWHLDGTRHVDHNKLLLEIAATLPDGSTLAPGATPVFTLAVRLETLFQHGAVGRDSVRVDNHAIVRSDGLLLGNNGDVLSNGPVSVRNQSTVLGDATGDSFEIDTGGIVTGALRPADPPVEFLPVAVPTGLVELGDFVVSTSTSLGVGSYHADKLEVVAGAELHIANADGPVTIYASGDVNVHNQSSVVADDPDPEKFALYLAGDVTARFTNDSDFYGVVYGPDAELIVDNGGAFDGAFVGGTMIVDNHSQVTYDEALHVNECSSDPLPFDVPVDLVVRPGERLALPDQLLAALTGHQLRIGRRAAPLVAVDGLSIGIVVPPDLEPDSSVELALVDALGCRSWRTVMVSVPEASTAAGGAGAVAALAWLGRRRGRRS
jgi:hypothetical protein